MFCNAQQIRFVGVLKCNFIIWPRCSVLNVTPPGWAEADLSHSERVSVICSVHRV